MANAAVAYASAVARPGPTIVTDSRPLGGAPVCGSTMCAPRSYSPDVATARSSRARTAARRSRSTGWRTPTRQRRAGSGRPRTTTPPPGVVPKRPTPPAPGLGPPAHHDVAAGVDAEALDAGGHQARRGAVDRPALHEAGRVEAAGAPGGGVATAFDFKDGG